MNGNCYQLIVNVTGLFDTRGDQYDVKGFRNDSK